MWLVCCRGNGPLSLSETFRSSGHGSSKRSFPPRRSCGVRSLTHAKNVKKAVPAIATRRNPRFSRSDESSSISQAHLRTCHVYISLGSTSVLVMDRFQIFGAQLSGRTQTLAVTLTERGVRRCWRNSTSVADPHLILVQGGQECARSFTRPMKIAGSNEDGPDGRVGFYEWKTTGDSWRGNPGH